MIDSIFVSVIVRLVLPSSPGRPALCLLPGHIMGEDQRRPSIGQHPIPGNRLRCPGDPEPPLGAAAPSGERLPWARSPICHPPPAGIGEEARILFWRAAAKAPAPALHGLRFGLASSLVRSLSALYPSGREERRWVDGVLTREKGLKI